MDASLAIIGLVVLVIVLYAIARVATDQAHAAAMQAQRLDDEVRRLRAELAVFNVDRARNHYGVPCATPACDCVNVPAAVTATATRWGRPEVVELGQPAAPARRPMAPDLW